MLNQQLKKIEKENAFSKSTRIVNEYKAAHPDADLVSLGIGDVSFPVAEPIVKAMKDACDDLATMEHFQGYGAFFGILSLRKAIAENDYKNLGITPDEIFVGDGTKTDSTALLELFDADSKILVGNPTYPIYQNGAYALGRDVFFAKCDEDFKMLVPDEHYDIIYICSPCNPVGNAYTKSELKAWISYANANKALIIYDNVYIDFVDRSDAGGRDIPLSIYELEGSRSCAVELRSFSKNASFSGTRCSYFVLPKELGSEIHELWRERTVNRFNGASYIAQKGAEASYSPEAKSLISSQIKVYKENARFLKEELLKLGFTVTGGIDAPYLWVETPDHLECWEAFEKFLNEAGVIVIPGLIFGSAGRYRLRLSALGTPDSCRKAIARIKQLY